MGSSARLPASPFAFLRRRRVRATILASMTAGIVVLVGTHLPLPVPIVPIAIAVLTGGAWMNGWRRGYLEGEEDGRDDIDDVIEIASQRVLAEMHAAQHTASPQRLRA